MLLDVSITAPLDEAASEARRLAGAGFDGLFTFEGRSDPFLPLVAAAPHTTELMSYTNIAVALPRSPMHLAMQAWDLQRLLGGRFALGLGTQIRAHIQRRYGSSWVRPLAQMREIIEATRAIFATWQDGEPMAFEGRWTTHTLMPPTLAPAPLPTGPPPIWLAALGPRMTALAGSTADGLLVHPFTSRRHLTERTLPQLRTGLDDAGRRRDELTVVVGAIVGLHGDDDEEQAVARVTAMLGFYGSTPAYRPVLDAHGWGELQPELRAMTKAGRWTELGDVFDQEMVQTLAVVGPPERVAVELDRRFGDIADRVALSTPGVSDTSLLADLAAAHRRLSRD